MIRFKLLPGLLIVTGMIFVGMVSLGWGAELGAIHEICGDLEFSYTSANGVSLSVFDIPIIVESSLLCVKPGWTHTFYNSRSFTLHTDTVEIKPYKEGKQIIIHHQSSGDEQGPFKATETFTLLPDNTYQVDLELIFTEDKPVMFEWNIGGINPIPIIGRSFVATDDALTTRGMIPLEAQGKGIEECMISRGFSRLEIDSRLGPIAISTKPEHDVSFFDYRKNRWASVEKPIFWLGILETHIKPNKTYSYSLKINVPEQIRKRYSEITLLSSAKPVIPASVVQSPNWGQNYIVPKPKEVIYTNTLFPVSSKTKVYTGKNPGKGIKNAVEFLVKDLKDLFDREIDVVEDDAPEESLPQNAIIIGEQGRYPLPADMCRKAGLTLPDNDEGYCLLAEKDRIYAAARTEQGLFYSLTTLLQLAQLNKDGLFFKGAKVVDYPSLKFRGIHCLSGKDAGDEIAKAVRTLMARFKINMLVWECEYIIWDSHPELEHPLYGMTKQEAAKVIEATKKYFIELVPLVQSLGHSEWIFVNDQNLDIAEDPQALYAYSPTNPDTYKFIFSVYQEALDFFKPRFFHIGHDEVTHQGRFPWRSRESGKTATDLIMEDINKLHEWFTDRGVRIMLWGDMFLYADEGTDACHAPSKEEAIKRRARLPEDVVITDWHYAPNDPKDYITLKLFNDAGHMVLGAGWYTPENIEKLARACILFDVAGYLQTTWAGFNFKIDNNEESWHQYWAYIWAAHYAWSGDTTPVDELPFSAKEMFLNLWSERKPVQKKRGGFYIDLRPLANRTLEDNEKGGGWIGGGVDNDLSAFPTGEILFGDTRFNVMKNDKGQAALFLSGKFNPEGTFPRSVEISLGDTNASALHFLMTAAFRTRNRQDVGEIKVKYRDGSSETLPLVYGHNIFAFDEERIGRNTCIAWQGENRKGLTVRVWDLMWDNPHPDKKISSLIISSAGTEAAPIILAITGVK